MNIQRVFVGLYRTVHTIVLKFVPNEDPSTDDSDEEYAEDTLSVGETWSPTRTMGKVDREMLPWRHGLA
jgi:hypothetical protein